MAFIECSSNPVLKPPSDLDGVLSMSFIVITVIIVVGFIIYSICTTIEMRIMISKCEEQLVRSQHCTLVAVPETQVKEK